MKLVSGALQRAQEGAPTSGPERTPSPERQRSKTSVISPGESLEWYEAQLEIANQNLKAATLSAEDLFSENCRLQMEKSNLEQICREIEAEVKAMRSTEKGTLEFKMNLLKVLHTALTLDARIQNDPRDFGNVIDRSDRAAMTRSRRSLSGSGGPPTSHALRAAALQRPPTPMGRPAR